MPPHDSAPAPDRKVCTKCGKAKPATTEFFAQQKTKIGVRFCASCRECDRARARAWNAANKERKAETNRKWAAANKTQIRARLKAWYTRNQAHVRAYRARNRERIQAYRIETRGHNNERMQAWRVAHPEQSRAIVRRRRAIQQAASGDHTGADIQRQYERQKGKCYYCGCKLKDRYDVDHIVPLSRGGSNGPENLVIACVTCNRRKNNRLPHEWPEGNRLL